MYSLYAEQSDAMDECLQHIINFHSGKSRDQVLIFSANAGAGKTYTANVTSKVLSHFGYTGTAIAFTGKAVTQLSKSGIPAQTFHSLMYKPILDSDGECIGFDKKPRSEVLDAAGSYILLDESSMIPFSMYNDLLAIGLPVIAIGDEAQLPPIDREHPDFNVMEIDDVPRITLLTNRRTDPECVGITKLSNSLRDSNGVPRRSGNGLKMVRKSSVLNVQFFRENEFDGVIVGTNKTRKSVTSMIRNAKGIDSPLPTIGEPIMCLRNGFVDGRTIANGEVFTVEAVFDKGSASVFSVRSVDNPDKILNVKVLNEFWETEKMPRMSKEVAMKYQQFTFGYAATCWKWQGSSLNRVLFIDEDISFFGDQQKFRYTAVSRAAKSLVYAF